MDIADFWRDVLQQNAAAIPSYFTEDAHINWHCTNERFTVAEFVRANCEYPGEWAGKIERAQRTDDGIVTATHVYSKADRTLSFHVTSFFRLERGRIAAMDEYWGDDGVAPQWRREKHIGRAISQGAET